MDFQILPILSNSLNITILVLILMMVIEYVNIRTKGSWSNFLQKHPSLQILFAISLGLVPGCIGTFAVVSMYTHRMISLGAIVAAFIATFGDEAFFMFSLIPITTLWMSLALIAIALVVGVVVDLIAKNKYPFAAKFEKFQIHHHHTDCVHVDLKKIEPSVYFSWRRMLIFSFIVFYIVAMFLGLTGHSHGPSMVETDMNKQNTEVSSEFNQSHQNSSVNKHEATIQEKHSHDAHQHDESCEHENSKHSGFGFESIMFVVFALILLYILLRVNEHFIKEHLWNHVVKVHFVKVFLWTFSAILLIGLLLTFFDLQSWIDNNKYAMLYLLLIALVIGIIPESGPHYIIIILFMNGIVPFSILLANSIVQEGHGGLPLLAESKKDFFLIKGINLLVGLIIGLVGFAMGW